jgi:hypothetical protein
LHQHDGLLPHWKQGGGKKKAKSVSRTQSWLAGATSENVELVAEGGVLDDEFPSRAAAEIGGNLERFNASRKRSELRPKAAGDYEDTAGDGGDDHGEVRLRFR